MNDAPLIPCIAVDGGGTRCRLALSSSEGEWRVEVGSANVSTDFDAALAEIRRGLNLLAAEAGVSADQIAAMPAYLGLAGVTGPQMAMAVRAALPFDRAQVEDDRAAALRGAIGDRDGFALHCGTGSFIAGRTGGRLRLVGGWGPVLGDPASAQWVGRQALARTLDVVDATAPASPLAHWALGRFGDAAGIVRFAASARPVEFGALAPEVTRRAAEGDRLAQAIMSDGARMMARDLRRLGWRQAVPICLTGGLGPAYADYLPLDMRAALTDPISDPMGGAIDLSQSFARGLASR